MNSRPSITYLPTTNNSLFPVGEWLPGHHLLRPFTIGIVVSRHLLVGEHGNFAEALLRLRLLLLGGLLLLGILLGLLLHVY